MTMTTDRTPILHVEDLEHQLCDKKRGDTFTVYINRTLEFFPGDFVGLLGPSGCGKTTILTLLGLLRRPSNLDAIGRFDLSYPSSDGKLETIDIKAAWKSHQRSLVQSIRRKHMGFSLQSGELVSSLTVTENIAVPLRLNNWTRKLIRPRTAELLQSFQLNRVKGEPQPQESKSEPETLSKSKRKNAIANSRVNRLSGGEYQRVCLARAIAHSPRVVFVDEPTSALNRELAHDALTVMRNVQTDTDHPGITFMITHDEELANRFCNVIVRMAPKKNESAGEIIEVTRANRTDGNETL